LFILHVNYLSNKKRGVNMKPENPKEFFKGTKFSKASGSYHAYGGGSGGFGTNPGGEGPSPVPGPICVEVAKKNGFVGVRDSQNPDGTVIAFTDKEWEVFIKGVKDGEFD
jgi:Domain of unknown function (DUF397)